MEFDWIVFGVFISACCAAAATGSMFPPDKWYDALRKPSWNPPNWVFPVVWSILYIVIAVAATRVAVLDGNALAMAFWGVQIALNTLWSPVFFGLNRIKAGMFIIVALWLAVCGAMVSAWQIDMVAGLLLAPYLVWVSIAAALNAAVWRLNPDKAGGPATA
ncbi:tryptophan-rich sensory protein [Dinoroseobacter sp. PD6]|uniref:tryptophan-rich sensory protein TspO n=1 Tax=Dinoroseobacter sp. PD6 TaxID=3028384 RepID=UPI00237AB9FE|nr:TspO/MBR family protein [Dinoroseobacter sp. PD6]MDD9718038.1 tryptophan-rich sensory protein [Dinoroseobacter sp. PD6]